jgi:cytochrome bd-type quinol oxidase subunit 1
MIALFAIGVITGTVLSFEMGVLWPNFTATFGGVFGLGFAIEGFSFFLEAIFLGIYAVSYDGLWALYLAVGAGTVWILRRLARMPVELPAPTQTPRAPEAIAWR